MLPCIYMSNSTLTNWDTNQFLGTFSVTAQNIITKSTIWQICWEAPVRDKVIDEWAKKAIITGGNVVYTK